jgi:hypothetical protein
MRKETQSDLFVAAALTFGWVIGHLADNWWSLIALIAAFLVGVIWRRNI